MASRMQCFEWDMHSFSLKDGRVNSKKKGIGMDAFALLKSEWREKIYVARDKTVHVVSFKGDKFLTPTQAKELEDYLQDATVVVVKKTKKELQFSNDRGATISFLLACSNSNFFIDDSPVKRKMTKAEKAKARERARIVVGDAGKQAGPEAKTVVQEDVFGLLHDGEIAAPTVEDITRRELPSFWIPKHEAIDPHYIVWHYERGKGWSKSPIAGVPGLPDEEDLDLIASGGDHFQSVEASFEEDEDGPLTQLWNGAYGEHLGLIFDEYSE